MWTKELCRVALPCTLLLLAWSSHGSEPGPRDRPEPSLGSSGPAAEGAHEAVGYRVFKWVSGNDRIQMIPARDGFCFLSTVGGSFAGGGESVRVYIDDGWWYLDGRCQQPVLWAEATCVEFNRLDGNQPPMRTKACAHAAPRKSAAATLQVEGAGYTIQTLDNGQRAFGNRYYVIEMLPERFRGWQFTRLNGGERARISVRGRRGQVVYIATAPGQPGIDLDGWQAVIPSAFAYSDRGHTSLFVYSRRLASAKPLLIPQGNWSGSAVLGENLLLQEADVGSQARSAAAHPVKGRLQRVYEPTDLPSVAPQAWSFTGSAIEESDAVSFAPKGGSGQEKQAAFQTGVGPH